jgi:hypothetical protein
MQCECGCNESSPATHQLLFGVCSSLRLRPSFAAHFSLPGNFLAIYQSEKPSCTAAMKLPLCASLSDQPISLLLTPQSVILFDQLEAESCFTCSYTYQRIFTESILTCLVVLCLASHSLAQTARAVGTLFQVDFTTNNGGGCQYVGQTTMQNNLQDSLGLLGVGAQLVTDYNNNVGEARRLLDSFFQVENPPMTAAQLQAIGSKYSRSSRRTFVAKCSHKCTLQQRTIELEPGLLTVELLTTVKKPGHRIYFVITIGFKNKP